MALLSATTLSLKNKAFLFVYTKGRLNLSWQIQWKNTWTTSLKEQILGQLKAMGLSFTEYLGFPACLMVTVMSIHFRLASSPLACLCAITHQEVEDVLEFSFLKRNFQWLEDASVSIIFKLSCDELWKYKSHRSQKLASGYWLKSSDSINPHCIVYTKLRELFYHSTALCVSVPEEYCVLLPGGLR
jgi:hypothetical protein